LGLLVFSEKILDEHTPKKPNPKKVSAEAVIAEPVKNGAETSEEQSDNADKS